MDVLFKYKDHRFLAKLLCRWNLVWIILSFFDKFLWVQFTLISSHFVMRLLVFIWVQHYSQFYDVPSIKLMLALMQLFFWWQLEEAKLLRAQGQHEMAINLAKYISQNSQLNEEASNVYRLVGKWLAETRSSKWAAHPIDDPWIANSCFHLDPFKN